MTKFPINAYGISPRRRIFQLFASAIFHQNLPTFSGTFYGTAVRALGEAAVLQQVALATGISESHARDALSLSAAGRSDVIRVHHGHARLYIRSRGHA